MGADDKAERAARLAHVLARAVRAHEVEYADARRVITHELRRLTTNKKLSIRPRSVEAQRVIDTYEPGQIPKNGSDDALHADHYAQITEATFQTVTTVDEWCAELARLAASIVCVTAAENYRLEHVETAGITGPEKYAAADIAFSDPTSWGPTTDP